MVRIGYAWQYLTSKPSHQLIDIMRKTLKRPTRLRKLKKAVKAGIFTATIFMLTYAWSLKKQQEFGARLENRETLAALQFALRNDMHETERFPGSINECAANKYINCTGAVELLIQSFNRMNDYIDVTQEIPNPESVKSIKSHASKIKKQINSTTALAFGLSIDQAKQSNLTSAKEFAERADALRESDKNLGLDLADTLNKTYTQILEMQREGEREVSRLIEDDLKIKSEHQKLQYYFLIATITEIAVFVIMNSVDIVINND